MKRFRILRSRKRLFFQSKQIFADLSITKTEIDVLKGTIRCVSLFFFDKLYCFYLFFRIWAEGFWLLAKLFQKVPKTSIYESLGKIRRDNFFGKNDSIDFHFWKWSGKKSICLPKSFGSVAENAFSWSTAGIEEKVWEKANFSISSGFWTKLSGFWANVFLHRQKSFFTDVKTALYFPEVHFEDKSLWRKSNAFESAYDFQDQKFYGDLARTTWQCHQKCFFESRRTNWRNKSSKLYFYLFWDYGEGQIIFDI